MEQYRLHHNNKVKPRNRAEHTLIETVKIAFTEPTSLTIEEIHSIVKNNYDIMPKSWGEVEISEITKGGRMAHNNNICIRYFSISHPSRGTYSLCVRETIMKDANNGFKPLVK